MKDKVRLIAILTVCILVIATGALYAVTTFSKGDFTGGVLGMIIAIVIVIFAVFVYTRGNKDMKKGFPLQDERSKRVIEKATSKAFLITLYLLLAFGFLSENIIHFRDVSQATSVAVGCMAILFAALWFYYNRKEI